MSGEHGSGKWHADLILIISKAAPHVVMYELLRGKFDDDLTVSFRSFQIFSDLSVCHFVLSPCVALGSFPSTPGYWVRNLDGKNMGFVVSVSWRQVVCRACLVVLGVRVSRVFCSTTSKRSTTCHQHALHILQMRKQEFRNLKAADEAQAATV